MAQVEYWSERGMGGFHIYQYRLVRRPGQGPLLSQASRPPQWFCRSSVALPHGAQQGLFCCGDGGGRGEGAAVSEGRG